MKKKFELKHHKIRKNNLNINGIGICVRDKSGIMKAKTVMQEKEEIVPIIRAMIPVLRFINIHVFLRIFVLFCVYMVSFLCVRYMHSFDVIYRMHVNR